MERVIGHPVLRWIGAALIVLSLVCFIYGYYQTHNDGYKQVSIEYEAYTYVDKELGSLYSPYSLAGMVNRGIASQFEDAANEWRPLVLAYENRAKTAYIAGGVLLALGIAAFIGSKKKEYASNVEESAE